MYLSVSGSVALLLAMAVWGMSPVSHAEDIGGRLTAATAL